MGCDRRSLPAAMALGLGLTLAGDPAPAQQRYDPGASDTEIKIGHIVAYSGLASPYGVIGRTEAAYFAKINAEGGIRGRKIRFISYDDGYNPAKTMEQARKLVESEEVLLIINSLGTPTSTPAEKSARFIRTTITARIISKGSKTALPAGCRSSRCPTKPRRPRWIPSSFP